MASYIRGVTTLHHYERISSWDLGLEKLRVLRMEVILSFLGGFTVGMMWPLDFEEFDRLVASLALSFFKNSNGVLMIRHVFLEINLFKVDGAVRSLETLAELRHAKHVMDVCKVGWKLKLIGEIASFAHDLERTHVSRGKLPFDTESTSTFHWRDVEVDMVSYLKAKSRCLLS